MNNVTSFINSFAHDSAEYEYHSAVFRIVSAISFDDTSSDCGIGLLEFLTEGDFIGAGINTLTHPIANSREENARLIAALFHRAERPVFWWAGSSLEGRPETAVWKKWWREKFEQSELVKAVY